MVNIGDAIQAMRGHKYFMMLDLAQAFHQLELHPEERYKKAFVTEMGVLQYKRLPMGLTDSPAYLQELINKVLGDPRFKICLGYFDDVFIFGDSIPDLVNNAQTV